MQVIVKKPTPEEIDGLDVSSWPIWEKEESSFDWYYDDKETCYILEGEVEVETDEGVVDFKAGDLVVFPKGLKCRWNIKKRVKKNYNFGE